MTSIHTAHGIGTIVDQNTVRGRTQFKVAGDGFSVWLDEVEVNKRTASDEGLFSTVFEPGQVGEQEKIPGIPNHTSPKPGHGMYGAREEHEASASFDFEPTDHVWDNHTTLPYNWQPQYPVEMFNHEQTISPDHQIDIKERMHDSDSRTGEDREPTHTYPGPNPDLFAKNSKWHVAEVEDDPYNQIDPSYRNRVDSVKALADHLRGTGRNLDSIGSDELWHVINNEMPPEHHGELSNWLSNFAGERNPQPEPMIPPEHRAQPGEPSWQDHVQAEGEHQDNLNFGPHQPEHPDHLGSYRPAGLSSKYADIHDAADHYNDPIQRFRDDPKTAIQRHAYIDISAGLDHETGEWMNLVAADKSIRTAAWNDVRQKAMRLKRDGAVHVKDMSPDHIYANVDGDNGRYEVMILKGSSYGGMKGKPTGQAIADWKCSCDWGKWAFKRQMTYVGRLCFLPGTKVVMADSTLKPIEEIVEGDLVRSHTGEARKVTATVLNHHDDVIYGVHPRGHETIWATGNHPFYARPHTDIKCQPCWDNNRQRSYCTEGTSLWKSTHRQGFNPQWVEAAGLTTNHWVSKTAPKIAERTVIFDLTEFCENYREDDQGRILRGMPTPQTGMRYRGTLVNRHVKLDEDLAYLFGLYLGDGSHPRGGTVGFHFGLGEQHLVDEVTRIAGEKFGLTPQVHVQRSGRNIIDVFLTSAIVTEFFHRYAGTGHAVKKLAPEILEAPASVLSHTLRGWIDSDNACSVNRNLVFQMEQIALRNGISCSVTTTLGTSQGNELVGNNTKDIYHLNCSPGRDQKSQFFTNFVEGDTAWVRIQGVEQKHYHGPVFNLSVEGEESYQVNGINTHNCSHGYASYLTMQGHSAKEPGHPFRKHWGSVDEGAQLKSMLRSLDPASSHELLDQIRAEGTGRGQGDDHIDMLHGLDHPSAHELLDQLRDEGRLGYRIAGADAFKTWCDKENGGHVDTDAADSYLSTLDEPATKEDAQAVFDYVEDHHSERPERDYDQDGYSNDPEDAYKTAADVLQHQPGKLTPHLYVVPEGEEQHFTDLGDDRKTTGPDQIQARRRRAKGADAISEHHPDFAWHNKGEDDFPEQGIVHFSRHALIYTADEDLLNKLRDLSQDQPSEHFHDMQDHNREVSEVVEELHDRGYAASPLVAMKRQAMWKSPPKAAAAQRFAERYFFADKDPDDPRGGLPGGASSGLGQLFGWGGTPTSGGGDGPGGGGNPLQEHGLNPGLPAPTPGSLSGAGAAMSTFPGGQPPAGPATVGDVRSAPSGGAGTPASGAPVSRPTGTPAQTGAGGNTYQDIVKSNPGNIGGSGTNIQNNPNLIHPGDNLNLPGGGGYTVQQGDTLSGIAQAHPGGGTTNKNYWTGQPQGAGAAGAGSSQAAGGTKPIAPGSPADMKTPQPGDDFSVAAGGTKPIAPGSPASADPKSPLPGVAGLAGMMPKTTARRFAERYFLGADDDDNDPDKKNTGGSSAPSVNSTPVSTGPSPANGGPAPQGPVGKGSDYLTVSPAGAKVNQPRATAEDLKATPGSAGGTTAPNALTPGSPGMTSDSSQAAGGTKPIAPGSPADIHGGSPAPGAPAPDAAPAKRQEGGGGAPGVGGMDINNVMQQVMPAVSGVMSMIPGLGGGGGLGGLAGGLGGLMHGLHLGAQDFAAQYMYGGTPAAGMAQPTVKPTAKPAAGQPASQTGAPQPTAQSTASAIVGEIPNLLSGGGSGFGLGTKGVGGLTKGMGGITKTMSAQHYARQYMAGGDFLTKGGPDWMDFSFAGSGPDRQDFSSTSQDYVEEHERPNRQETWRTDDDGDIIKYTGTQPKQAARFAERYFYADGDIAGSGDAGFGSLPGGTSGGATLSPSGSGMGVGGGSYSEPASPSGIGLGGGVTASLSESGRQFWADAFDPGQRGYYNPANRPYQEDDSEKLGLPKPKGKGKAPGAPGNVGPQGVPAEVAPGAGAVSEIAEAAPALIGASYGGDDSDVVRRFHASGAGALGAPTGGSNGAYSDDAIATSARKMIRTAGRHFTRAEERELEDEFHPKGARNLKDLDLTGTHYLDE